VRRICRVLGLPRSSFYHAVAPSPARQACLALASEVRRAFTDNRCCYGYRRIHRELLRRRVECGAHTVRRIMGREGIQASRPRHFVPRTSDGKASKPSPNLLADSPLPESPDRAWAGDITYIPCGSGWLYLAVIIDLCSRRVVGWSLSGRMHASLVTGALEQAIQSRNSKDVIFHSDRGSQYSSGSFRGMLASGGLRQSMSARANPYDNAWTESFIGKLKAELIGRGSFRDIGHARMQLFSYIDGFYNTHRLHSSLNYCSPVDFEDSFRDQPKGQTV
jgi:putative transposase